jgi:hypothetical protein
MNKYIYINKKTGQKIYCDTPRDLKDFELVMEARDTKMSSKKIIKKTYGEKS